MDEKYLKILDNDFLPDEDNKLEYKKSEKSLSNDIWESICAFENTSGGYIYLGVVEDKSSFNRSFYKNGIHNKNKQKIMENFWTVISNNNDLKLSYSTINNDDIHYYDLNKDKSVIVIHVKEAPRKYKPVFSNQRAYIRRGSTDIIANNEEIKTMYRDAHEDIDNEVLTSFSLDDLNMEDIIRYRYELQENPKHKRRYSKLDLKTFLKHIGVISIDNDGNAGITVGGLLFFGYNSSIIRKFPYFQLDYFNKSEPTTKRYLDRISSISDDLNIYSFFYNVLPALSITAKSGFKLNDDKRRIDVGDLLKETIREGMVNMLMHADYFEKGASTINVMPNYYTFNNPGKMLVSDYEFFNTDKTVVRNPTISKLFVLIGAGERAGTGGETIQSNAISSGAEKPSIESPDVNTLLKVWTVDYVKTLSGNQLSTKEKDVLSYIAKTPLFVASHKEIEKNTGYSKATVSKYINMLIKKGILIRMGAGRSTKYSLPNSDERILSQIEEFSRIMRKNIQNHSGK